MRRLRFLLSRRWLVFFVVVVALAWLAWRLGEWQFHRLDDRRDRNAIIERNARAGTVPVEQAMGVGDRVETTEEWQVVEAEGTYAPDDTVIVRYRTREGSAGVDVVVPLELGDGTSVLVDRGWFATDNRGAAAEDVPAPPPGRVTVTGWLRKDATGDSTRVADRSTRAINSTEIGEALARPVLTGFLDLRAESPEAAEPLMLADPPELDNGPHFFYGLQWWFFGLLAVVGFFYLLYDEWRGGHARGARSEGTEHPAVDREHHPAQE